MKWPGSELFFKGSWKMTHLKNLRKMTDRTLEAKFLELVRLRRSALSQVDVINIEYSLVQFHREMSRRAYPSPT